MQAARSAAVRVSEHVAAAPPRTLTLVSAWYDQDAGTVTLAFERAIDAAAFVGTAVALADGVFSGGTFEGAAGPPAVLNPTTIVVSLEEVGPAPLPSVTVSASASTGIVAVDDGGTWAGVSQLGLPFDG